MKTPLIDYLPDSFDLSVPSLQPGQVIDGGTIACSSSSNRACFYRSPFGVIYYIGIRRTFNLGATYQCNDVDRRVWCKLAGVKMSALKNLLARNKTKAEAREKSEQLYQLKKKADRHGYILVKKGA